MQVASKFMSLQKLRSGLVALGAIYALACGAAQAQNLDQGKSAARLFADGCTACHRSARGLAKGRFSLTLFLFLQKHYASNSSSAWELSSYLESVDDGSRNKSRAATSKRAAASSAKPGSSVRPPAAVPSR